VYFVAEGVRYWLVIGPGGYILYRKEGSRTRYVGRRTLEEVRRLLAAADPRALAAAEAELEEAARALEAEGPPEPAARSLTWRAGGGTCWPLMYGATVHIYCKGPGTGHRPKLVERTDVEGLVRRLRAEGAMHVAAALKSLVDGLRSAVADLLKPQRPAAEAQRPRSEPAASRREAEEALEELRRELARAVRRWGSEGGGGPWGPDPGRLREKVAEFLAENRRLVERVLPHPDLLGKLADAVEEETYGYLARSDILEILEQTAHGRARSGGGPRAA